MKIKPGFYKIALLVAVVAVIIYLAFFGFFFRSFENAKTTTLKRVDNEVSVVSGISKADGFDDFPDIKDTLMSYRQYERIEDSLKRMRDYKESLKNPLGSGSYGSNEAIGYMELNECDTCPDFLSAVNRKVGRKYIVLGGYTLNHGNDQNYFMEKGKSFLEYAILDKVKTDRQNNKVTYGHYAYKELPFRYAEKGKYILVPCKPSAFTIFKNAYNLITALLALFYFIVIFVLPLKILLNISKGNVFSKRNISSLYLISYSLFAVVLISPLISIALRFLFGIYRFPEFRYDYWGLVDKNYVAFIAVIALGVAKAFSKGFQIQQEQALTV
jgi:hypothetical protein